MRLEPSDFIFEQSSTDFQTKSWPLDWNPMARTRRASTSRRHAGRASQINKNYIQSSILESESNKERCILTREQVWFTFNEPDKELIFIKTNLQNEIQFSHTGHGGRTKAIVRDFSNSDSGGFLANRRSRRWQDTLELNHNSNHLIQTCRHSFCSLEGHRSTGSHLCQNQNINLSDHKENWHEPAKLSE